ncbi:MAG: 4Fe-4S dicluster domain-containing protein [Desulfobacterales bacterium]|nr:4Fe-4S dicluster domain-containing protein [Desulfobacterales bacterium]
MIKRSFFALSQPRLTYDLLEPDPKTPEEVPLPASLTLLLRESIDTTREALFKKGDSVKKGEKLKLYEDSTAYVLSPVAGTISNVDTYPDDFGNWSTYVAVQQDPAADAACVCPAPSETLAYADEHLRELPGAPPFAALAAPKNSISTIVVTCSDPDLLCTTRQYAGTTAAADLRDGMLELKKLTSVPKLCLAIPEDVKLSSDFDNFQVLRTSKVFPSALPAMIMKDHLDMVLPAGQTPEEAGVCFISSEAVVSLARVYATGKPAFEKVFTLVAKDGQAHRVKAVIGTPLSNVLSQFSIHVNPQDRIVVGGPMTGFATFTSHHPVTPDMDMVMIQDRDIIPELSDNACVNCGKCIRICPANVPVNLLVRYLEADEYEEAAERFDLESCIECGLCAYVCTARIPITQYVRLGKHELLQLRADA